MQLVQGLHGREVVDVDGENLVAYLLQHRVVELENGELVTAAGGSHRAQVLGHRLAVAVVGFELLQHLIGPVDDGMGHSGNFRHMDAEGVLAAALHQLAHEHHLAVNLLDTDVVVDDAFERALHLIELVVMRGKECLGPGTVLVDVLHDGPSDGDTVVGARAAPQLVEEHEAALTQVVQNRSCLGHLDHEGGLAQRDVVAGSHTGEDFVNHADTCALRRHETAHLRHQGDESRLSQQRTLTGHVRASDDHDLLAVVAQADVVGHITLAGRQLALDDCVAALHDVDVERFVEHGAVVVILGSHPGERRQAVELRNEIAVVLDSRYVLGDRGHQLGKEAPLDDEDFLLGPEDFLLIFLEFLRDITLGIDQRLLAYPLGRHLVAMGVAHLDIVAEDVVISDFETRNARALALGALHLHQVVLARIGNLPQLVELGVDTGVDDIATPHLHRRVGIDFAVDALADERAWVELVAKDPEHVACRLRAHLLHGLYGLQGAFELHQFARRDAVHSHLADEALHIADEFQLLLEQVARRHVTEKILHHIEPAVDGFHILQGKERPPVHHPRPHGADGAVEHAEQRLAALVERSHQFKVAHGELVEPHIALGLDARQRGDVLELVVLGQVEIIQNGTRGHDGTVHRRDAEPLEVVHLEVAKEPVGGAFQGERPVVHLEGEITGRERLGETPAVAALDEHLLGREVPHQLVHIVDVALGSEKLAGADVEKGHPYRFFAKMNRGQEVVLLAVEDGAAHHHTGGHQLGDAALHQLLGELGVLELVADGHALAGPDELGQIGVERMMRKAGHLGGAAYHTRAPRERDAQNLGGGDRIGTVGLIEVAHTEQQHRIGMLCFHLVELFHHRCERFLSHGVGCSYVSAKLRKSYEKHSLARFFSECSLQPPPTGIDIKTAINFGFSSRRS